MAALIAIGIGIWHRRIASSSGSAEDSLLLFNSGGVTLMHLGMI